MSRLTRDGTAEIVWRDQFPRRVHGDREISIFPVQLITSRIDSLSRLMHTLLYVMTIHTYILPRVRRHRASIVPKLVPVTGAAFLAGHHGPNNAHLFFPTPINNIDTV